jgi:hypothetical protein
MPLQPSENLPSRRRRASSCSVTLDPSQLTRELIRRGTTPSEFAAIAGVTPEVMTKVMRGRPIRSDAAARIACGLDGLEVLRGAAGVIAHRRLPVRGDPRPSHEAAATAALGENSTRGGVAI